MPPAEKHGTQSVHHDIYLTSGVLSSFYDTGSTSTTDGERWMQRQAAFEAPALDVRGYGERKARLGEGPTKQLRIPPFDPNSLSLQGKRSSFTPREY